MTMSILEAALRSSGLIVMVWLLLRALRVHSASVERTAWLAVLVASIAMPFAVNFDVLPTAVAPAVGWLPQTNIGALTIADGSSEWHLAVVSALAWVYLGAVAALCLRQFLGLARLWRMRAAATPFTAAPDQASDIRKSEAVSSPATAFSTILVPPEFATWSTQEREAVLAHERAHIANGDFYLQVVAHLHRNVFWFNPLAWWLPRRLSLLSEHVSDDAAIATIREPTAYAGLLLSCARKALDDEHAIAMARTATLATRVERILDASSPPSRAPRWKHLGIAALMAPFVAISATLQAKEEGLSLARATGSEPFADYSGGTMPPAERDIGSRSAKSNVTLPRSIPERPLSQPVYPPASRRLLETGTVVLKLHVIEDGSVGDAIIEKSSGYPSLDYAAMYESFRWRLEPGTVDGQPQRMWGQFAVTFKLTK